MKTVEERIEEKMESFSDTFVMSIGSAIMSVLSPRQQHELRESIENRFNEDLDAECFMEIQKADNDVEIYTIKQAKVKVRELIGDKLTMIEEKAIEMREMKQNDN